jgi:poly-gamma-glutamate system protein
MKTVYWRPRKISRYGLLLVGAVASVGLLLVELFPTTRRQPHHAEKLAAARLAAECMQAIASHRPEHARSMLDPRGTGMLGDAMTAITSKPADWDVKRRSVDPNFAAVFVQLLKDAGVAEGDTVAVGWTGSFPGFNASLAAALETLQLRPLVVASVMASQYGANHPDYTWLDMERVLRQQGLISFRSRAASIGGPADRGLGMMAESLAACRAAMRRNDVALLTGSDHDLASSIQARMDLYATAAGDVPVVAYVNVGGGIASTGGRRGKPQFQAGLNREFQPAAEHVDCVMRRFLERGAPVLQLVEVNALAAQFGLEPTESAPEKVGSGGVYARTGPRRWLAAVLLIAVLFLLHSLVLSGTGHQFARDLARWVRPRRRRAWAVVGSEPPHDGPQLMV